MALLPTSFRYGGTVFWFIRYNVGLTKRIRPMRGHHFMFWSKEKKN